MRVPILEQMCLNYQWDLEKVREAGIDEVFRVRFKKADRIHFVAPGGSKVSATFKCRWFLISEEEMRWLLWAGKLERSEINVSHTEEA